MISNEAKRLRLFRKTFKITQKDLSEKAGVYQTYISKYENGSLEIPINFVKALHKHFQLNYTWFFEGVGSMKAAAVDRKALVTDIKDVMADVEILKAQNAAMSKTLRELHAAFYADKYGP